MRNSIIAILIVVMLFGIVGCSQAQPEHSTNPTSTNQSDTIAENDLLDNLGGVITTDVTTMESYLSAIYKPCHIQGKIIELEFDEDDNSYTYKIRDDTYYSTIKIYNCSQRFDEQDYIYAEVTMHDKYEVRCNDNGLSLQKSDVKYITVKEYQNLCDKISHTQFKITGYIFIEKQGSGAYSHYDYYMYQSEESYGNEDANRIEIRFISEPENINGNKIQIIGRHEPGDYGIVDASIIND